MSNREPLFLELAAIYSGIKAMQQGETGLVDVALAAVRKLETSLDHLFVGARIARDLLAHKDTEHGLTSSEREWLEAERTRKAAT